MIKNLMDHLNYGFFAEASLLMFVLIFIGVSIRTLVGRSDDSRNHAMVVLHDGEEKNQ